MKDLDTTDSPIIQEPVQKTLGYRAKRLIMDSVANGISWTQGRFTEEVQVHGGQNIAGAEGPFLWLVKHECSVDHLYLAPLWLELSDRPDVRIAKRVGPKGSLESILDKTLLSGITFQVERTSRPEEVAQGEREAAKARNERRLAAVNERYHRGIHALMFPEGTTYSDGTIGPVKAGCYNVSFFKSENGDVSKVQIVPVGLTLDMLSGSKWGKSGTYHLPFVNVGAPFVYEQVEGMPDNPTDVDVKADIAHHTERVKQHFLDLNVFTVAQLAGEYIVARAKAGNNESVSVEDLYAIVGERVKALQSEGGFAIDHKISNGAIDTADFSRRIQNFYGTLERRGYIVDGKVNSERVLAEVNTRNPRIENPLEYCTNRVLQIMSERPVVNEIMQRTYAQKVGS